MNRAATFLFPLLIIVPTSPADSTEVQGPTRAEVEATMGLPSEGDSVRGQMDTTGFVVEEAPAEDAVSTAIMLEQESLAAQDQRLGMTDGRGFIGGVCPHDDHLYAGRVYVHLTERITAEIRDKPLRPRAPGIDSDAGGRPRLHGAVESPPLGRIRGSRVPPRINSRAKRRRLSEDP